MVLFELKCIFFQIDCPVLCLVHLYTEKVLKIRRDYWDSLGIISHFCIKTHCDPSWESSRLDGSNEGLQCIFSLRKKNNSGLSPKLHHIWSSAEITINTFLYLRGLQYLYDYNFFPTLNMTDRDWQVIIEANNLWQNLILYRQQTFRYGAKGHGFESWFGPRLTATSLSTQKFWIRNNKDSERRGMCSTCHMLCPKIYM